MTIRTLMTNEEECKRLEAGEQSFVIRSARDYITKGNLIKFQLMKNGKPVLNTIQKKLFIVTAVIDSESAPVVEGHQFISFKEVRQ